jgi:hypothetical protein
LQPAQTEKQSLGLSFGLDLLLLFLRSSNIEVISDMLSPEQQCQHSPEYEQHQFTAAFATALVQSLTLGCSPSAAAPLVASGNEFSKYRSAFFFFFLGASSASSAAAASASCIHTQHLMTAGNRKY